MIVEQATGNASSLDASAAGWLPALDLLGQGFAVFDADLKLVACNARFGVLRDVPAPLRRPGASLEDIVRFFAQRGDYGPGQVDALVRAAIAPSREARAETAERRMPDGRIILVEMRPIPTGGMLIVYSDVTDLRRRENELRDAREAANSALRELQALLDTIEYGILFLDADMRIRIANRAYRRMWQFPEGFFDDHPTLREDMEYTRGQGMYYIPNGDWEAYLEARVEGIRRGDLAPTELRMADGRVVQYQCIALPHGGRMLTYFDITALKQREEELRAKTAILGATLENMDQGITMVDAELNVIAFNRRFIELLDLPADRFMLGFNLEEAFRFNAARGEYGPGDVEAMVRERMERQRRFEPHHFERVRPDGTVLEIRGIALPGGGMVSTYTDITQQRKAEAALREAKALLEEKVVQRTAEAVTAKDAAQAAEREVKSANERFLAAAESMADALAIYDAEDTLAFYNTRYPEHYPAPHRAILRTGVKYDDLLAELLAIGPIYHAEMGPDYVERRRALRRLPTAEHETRLLDGRWLRIREAGMPGGGRVITTTDITGQKQAEAELARQREALVQSEKLSAFGSLLAGVAHELNNPLSIVVAQSALLQETTNDPKVLLRSEKISTAAERCAKIVKTFLAMARRRPPEHTAVNLNDTVAAALEVLAYGLRSAGIEVVRELYQGLPVTRADADQLHQVVTNLLINAQQAMMDRPGRRRLRIATAFDTARQEIRLVVDDTGPGVPRDLRAKIFEPFFTTKPAGTGLGFGLALCHGLMEAHGGSITVDDAPGGGARFVVTMPCKAPVGAQAPAPGREAPRPRGGRILIIDDEPDIAATCADILAIDGHRCELAENGQTALEKIAAGGFDLILSDMRMPRLDGPGFYRELCRVKPALAARVMFLTGDTLSPAIQRFLDEAKRPYIEKPLDPRQLRQAVAAALATVGKAP
jgi:C4-dicarboxylate-specific signal transduction histidine kinase/ActR/RegA family two-component response regulator